MTKHTSLLTELLSDKNTKPDENFVAERRTAPSAQVYQTENIMTSPPPAFSVTTSETKPHIVSYGNNRYAKVAACHHNIAECWYLQCVGHPHGASPKLLITNKQLAAIMNTLKPGCITEDALYSRGNTQGCTYKVLAPVSLTSMHVRPQTVWPLAKAAAQVSKMCDGVDLHSLLVADAAPAVDTNTQTTTNSVAASDLEAEAILQQKQAFSGTPRRAKRANVKATTKPTSTPASSVVGTKTVVLFNDLVNKALEIADHVIGLEKAHDELQAEHALIKADLQTAESTINSIATTAASVHDKKLQIAAARAEASDVPFTGAVSLKHCLAAGSFYTSDRLYKNGFFSCEDMFQVFSNMWVDETGTLVNKDHFQRVVRSVFHQDSSTSERPRLRASAIRNKEATLCPIVCPKKPNPVDGNDDPMDLDNPAYVSNNTPCVRLQPRYTAKAVEQLKKVWNKYLPNPTQDV